MPKLSAIIILTYVHHQDSFETLWGTKRISGLLGLFHDPFGGDVSDELKTQAANWTSGLFHDPFGGDASDELKTHAASPQAFLLSKLAEASFARSDNKKPHDVS